MADFTWVGGSTGDFNVASNWSPPQVPSYGTLGVSAGTSIIMPGSGKVTLNGLSITGTGSVTFIGGTLAFNKGLAPPVGDNVTLQGTVFSTSSSLGGGGGTITLNGATVTGSGSAATGSFIFDTVASAGTGNTLSITAQSTGLVIPGFGYGDAISVGSGNTLTLSLNAGSSTVYTLTDNHGGYTTTISSNVTLAAGTVAADFTSSGGVLSYTGVAPCFYMGTRLATPDGDIAVEDIVAGTLLMTASGEIKPVRWLGWSRVSSRFADPVRSFLIRIKAAALGDSLPLRDLLVSPDHAMFIEGVLVQAGAVVNGVNVIREAELPEIFTYYHVELDTHELLLAEGAATESFVDNVDRMNFENWAEHELVAMTKPIREMDYPRAKSSRQIPISVRQALAVGLETRVMAA